MKATYPILSKTWLRTDKPVTPVNSATWNHLPEIEAALHRGVTATADLKRPGFYEIEVGDHWYYVHVPKRLRSVYLVAVQRRLAGIVAHQPAC